VFRIRV